MSETSPILDEQVWALAAEDTARHRELAEADPARFLWAADPGVALEHDDGSLQELLLPSVCEAELAIGLRWLGHRGFLDDDDAAALIEQKLDSAAKSVGLCGLVDALEALARRTSRHRAARHLEALLERFRPDRAEAAAVETVAALFVDAPLLLSLASYEPWKSKPSRLQGLADSCPTDGIALALRRRIAAHGDLGEMMMLWRTLATRKEDEALDSAAEILAGALETPLGHSSALDVVLALQRVHGDDAMPQLVAVFLSGAHRSPAGESIERWLVPRARKALETALDDLPDWMPRFERTAMDRLCWQLLPKLSGDDRERILDLADVVGGERGQMVIDELESLG